MKNVFIILLIAIIGWACAKTESVAQRGENTENKPVEQKQSENEKESAEDLRVTQNKEEDRYYTTKYDNIDLDEILKSDRLLQGYFNCLVDKGSCTPDGQELKNLLPDALHNGCSKCNEKQRNGAKKVIRFLIDEKPAMWNELEALYDKDGEYKKKYRTEIEKEGLKI